MINLSRLLQITNKFYYFAVEKTARSSQTGQKHYPIVANRTGTMKRKIITVKNHIFCRFWRAVWAC
jgi:hypothetical protein